MNLLFARMQRFTSHGVVVVLSATLLLPRLSAQGTPGPGGVNVGLDFNWPGGFTGYTASFINTGGLTVNNCSGGAAVNASTAACSFVFGYSVAGAPQTPVTPGGSYETWTPPGRPPGNVICDTSGGLNNNTAPLTFFNCFNQNSFGQLFVPTVSGALSGVSMSMTCLNPAGTTLTGLFALIYLMTNNGHNLPAAPLATVPVNLASCPTLTSWNGHTFVPGDFATIPLNFLGVNVTAGNVYGVFFGGLTPGQQPPGSPTVTSVSPASGPTAGGTTVTITGTGLTGATSVTFGGTAAASFTVVNDTTITATTPAGAAGAVSVIVTTPNGTNSANTLYTYAVSPPTVTSVSPNSGLPAGGNTVTITGTGFTGATSVTFGGTAATSFTVVNDTTITAVVPAAPQVL